MAGNHRPLGQSERARLDPFEALSGTVPPRDQRDLMERPFFSLSKARRIAPILYKSGDTEVHVYAVPEHGLATIWDADVLIWAASQLLARSEEHTSELQSLMRISYAVFCLKKKKKNP